MCFQMMRSAGCNDVLELNSLPPKTLRSVSQVLAEVAHLVVAEMGFRVRQRQVSNADCEQRDCLAQRMEASGVVALRQVLALPEQAFGVYD